MGESKTNGPSGQQSGGGNTPRIEWNDDGMSTSYSNICNVAGTREEVSIFFGTNVTWKPGSEAVEVRVDQRIVLNPFTAKRLQLLLTNLLREYESRFGEIQLDATRVSTQSEEPTAS